MSVSVYFTKFKKLWDDIACIDPLFVYTCGVVKEIIEIANKGKLMQFLMGLNDSYK